MIEGPRSNVRKSLKILYETRVVLETVKSLVCVWNIVSDRYLSTKDVDGQIDLPALPASQIESSLVLRRHMFIFESDLLGLWSLPTSTTHLYLALI